MLQELERELREVLDEARGDRGSDHAPQAGPVINIYGDNNTVVIGASGAVGQGAHDDDPSAGPCRHL